MSRAPLGGGSVALGSIGLRLRLRLRLRLCPCSRLCLCLGSGCGCRLLLLLWLFAVLKALKACLMACECWVRASDLIDSPPPFAFAVPRQPVIDHHSAPLPLTLLLTAIRITPSRLSPAHALALTLRPRIRPRPRPPVTLFRLFSS